MPGPLVFAAVALTQGCSPDRCLIELLLRVLCMVLPGC